MSRIAAAICGCKVANLHIVRMVDWKDGKAMILSDFLGCQTTSIANCLHPGFWLRKQRMSLWFKPWLVRKTFLANTSFCLIYLNLMEEERLK